MKKVDELKIGEEFQLGDRRFRIEKDKIETCVGCFFIENDIPCEELKIYSILPQCNRINRKDKKDVVFKEVKND